MGRIGEISHAACIPSKLSVLLKSFLRRARWPAAHIRRSWIRLRAAVNPARSVVSSYSYVSKEITGFEEKCLSSRAIASTNTFYCGSVSKHKDHAYMHDLMLVGYEWAPFSLIPTYGYWLSSLTAGTLVYVWDHYNLLLLPFFNIHQSACAPREWAESGVLPAETKL